MGSPLPLFLWINLVIYFFTATKMIVAQQIEAAHVFDHVLGRYAFESYNAHNKTGFLYEVQFPGNLSDIKADTVRFRCGSLKRYGAQIKEFSLAMGVTVQPCVERVLIVRQNLGEHWSPIYFDTTKVSATYQLVSHVLGLVAYDATNLNSTNLSEVELHAGKNPIKIDFSNVVKINSTSDITLLCASFDSNGKTSVSPQISPNICSATRHGHFALVIESFLSQIQENSTTKASRWKIIVGSTLGGALGVFLLGLLFHAMLVKVKKKSERVQMERRAYEEEALQISMVGHVRAPTASGTRTQPSLEHDYIPPI